MTQCGVKPPVITTKIINVIYITNEHLNQQLEWKI